MNKNKERIALANKYFREWYSEVLDLGSAGMKGTTENLHLELKKTIPVKGVDIEKNENVDYIANLNETFPFRNNSVDMILAFEVIEHIENPYQFIRECNRVLKQESKIIITTPNSAGLPYILKNPVIPQEDITMMNLDVLNANADFLGFNIIESGYLNNYYRRNLLLRLIGFMFKRIRPTIYLVMEKKGVNK